MTPTLSVKNLTVEIPTRKGVLTVLDDMSFDIAPGEILGMVGESGAGKSVTGAAVIGLLEPPGRIASGHIELSGQRIDTLSAARMRRIRGARIGMIFQDPLTSLNPLFTIGDQLVETIRAHATVSRKVAMARAEALLTEVGIPGAQTRLSSYPHQFSGGMRQRVVIALALAAAPDLIIADEPTTALDVSVQAQIIRLLKRLCRERGTSVLLITHDMGVIAETADRVCVLYSGRIAEIGAVEAVLMKPQHPYTIGLMAAIPTLDGDRATPLVQIPGAMPRVSDRPSGCAFHPRCHAHFARCDAERPEVRPDSKSGAACFLSEFSGDTK